MATFLAIWLHSPSGNKRLGTLEMSYQVSKDGVESRGWEWRASGNGNPDGGGWEWVYDSNRKRICIELKSGVRDNKVVAIMLSMEHWTGSKIPPNQPWFVGSSFFNHLHYTDPNGTTTILGWEPLK
jgi:hypothetical protein